MAAATATVTIKAGDIPEVAALIKHLADLNDRLMSALTEVLDVVDVDTLPDEVLGDACLAIDSQRNFAASLDARDAERSFQFPPTSEREV